MDLCPIKYNSVGMQTKLAKLMKKYWVGFNKDTINGENHNTKFNGTNVTVAKSKCGEDNQDAEKLLEQYWTL